jgi:hypothetical protein
LRKSIHRTPNSLPLTNISRWYTRPDAWMGMVRRIDTGWLPNNIDYLSQIPARPYPPARWGENFQRNLYSHFQDYRDMDYETLRRTINKFSAEDAFIPKDVFENLVYKVAFEGKYVVWVSHCKDKKHFC